MIIDPVWGEPAARAIAAAAENARFVQIGSSAGQESTLIAPLIRNKMLTILGHTNFATPFEVQRAAFMRMADHGVKGELTVEVERFGLDTAADAWRRRPSRRGASS